MAPGPAAHRWRGNGGVVATFAPNTRLRLHAFRAVRPVLGRAIISFVGLSVVSLVESKNGKDSTGAPPGKCAWVAGKRYGLVGYRRNRFRTFDARHPSKPSVRPLVLFASTYSPARYRRLYAVPLYLFSSISSARGATAVQQPPYHQLELSEAELDKDVTKILKAENPHAPKNIVRYSHKENGFKPLPSIDQVAVHFSMAGCAVVVGAAAGCC